MIRPWVAKRQKLGLERLLAFGVGHFSSPVYRRILALKLRVTEVTMTSGWVQDMIQVSGVANEETEVHSLPYQ